MASLAAEMPPLHTAESLVGVTEPASSQSTSGGGGPGGSGGVNNSGIDSTQARETETVNNTTSHTTSNNTISAAADSSDNQPGTPQPHLSNANEVAHNSAAVHHPYANHHIYSNSQPSTTTAANTHLNQIYSQHIYSQSNMDLQQQQQQQLQQPLTPTQHSSYPSYLNSYEQFYQQQQQQQQQQQSSAAQSSNQAQNPQQMDFINSNSNSLYAASEFKQAGLRYHPYLHAPTSGIPSVNSQNSNSNNALDANSQTAPVVSSATSSVMSPRVVSSTSPSSSSNQMQISGSASSLGSMSAGNPSSPNSAVSFQCKKCGIMCTNESELQEHITNVHGASPYGSSGYASSPYIKEEMQQKTPPSQSQQQQQQPATQQQTVQGGNPGEILDLDSQKMLYPPAAGSMAGMMQQPLGSSDPLHGLHTMQQRAGVNSWDQQSQEGLPPYLQPQQQQQQPQTTESKNLPNHSPFYQSPKQSPYDVTNSSNVIKSEYQPLIKTEYTADTQQYLSDKSFDPTASSQQQQMMPPAVSSSPAEFPSTTTGGPQDNGQQNVVGNQQFRAGNFEPPSSSSAALTSGPVGSKAANWKSNEARRPKTYNCTACNKWFTSSGHLKRHYNTTLHKNAVKSSGQPDPATLPISVHHHPARDPSGKAGRRGAAAAAAANAANSNAQQPPNPVQPPEPPNSPQDYGGPQVAADGLTPLSHYAATPSPNSMYQQQHYQHHQYMPQVQSTTNDSPQHAASMVNHHLQQQQQHLQTPQQQQQQTVMNGHPNALAGLSVQPTQQQASTPSSQMRGLLNITMSSTTLQTPIRIIKSEHLEAATMEEQMDPDEEVEELGLTRAQVKEEYSEEAEGHNMYSPKAEIESVQDEEMLEEALDHQESELVLQQQGLQEAEELAVGVLREVDPNVELHHSNSQLSTLKQIQHFQLQQPQSADMDRLYQNSTPNSTLSNMQVHSPLIISHQQYQDQLQQHHQMEVQDTYTLTQIPSPPQQLQPNIMEHQPYINMHSGINTQQPPNNMLQLQPPLTTTEQQQLPPATTIHTTNMVNMLPPNHQHMQPPQQQHTELQPLVNTQLQLDTINTSIPSHITTSNITNIPSFHHLQQPGSVLPPLEPTLTYPHTIIGNAEVLTLDAYGNLVSASRQHQQVIQTTDGQFVQLISTGSATATSLYTTQSYNPYLAQRSPQEGDLPPMTQHYQQEPTTATTLAVIPSYTSYSPENSSEIEYKPSLNDEYLNSNCNEEPQQRQQQQTISKSSKTETTAVTSTTSSANSNKRKRNPSTSSSVGANSTMLPSGRIKCLPCDKEFTKICYLTQHNKSFHSGEYPFRCQKCGKRYQSEDVYNIHLGKHKTTDKAHKCQLCPKQFHHKTDLRRHIEAIHTGNKQHSCDICEKSFCRKDHLRKHMETHNRPRVVTKKPNSRGKNSSSSNSSSSSLTTALVKVNKKSKDLRSGANKTTKKSLSSPGNNLLVNQLNSCKPAHANETNSLSSTTTSLPSPLMQQIEEVAADDEFLEDDFDEYDGQEMEETEDYLTLSQYEQEIQSQYTLGKYQVYQIVEQKLPMY